MKLKHLYWVAVILWMGIIFYFSHQPGTDSSNLSQGVMQWLIQASEKVIPIELTINMEQFHFFIRKNAHFFAYFTLGIFLILALRSNVVHGWRGVISAFFIAVAYAISDEFHQSFIPGRSAQATDVFIDSVGAAVGIGLFMIMVTWKGKVKHSDVSYIRFIETFIIALIGGALFAVLGLPLPWILGSLTTVCLWQGILQREMYIPQLLKNSGFAVLGLSFGLYFTRETVKTILPFAFPFLLLTSLLIFISIVLGFLVTKWIRVDQVTSVFSCIPGGLSEMTLASQTLSGKPSLVVIFQTIRLVTVLFTIPFIMTMLFSEGIDGPEQALLHTTEGVDWWSYFWFTIPIGVAFLIKDRIPAGIIVGALGITAIMNISPITLPSIPSGFVILGQVFIGTSLGKDIFFKDLKLGGKYSFVYFGLSLLIILISVGLGIIFSLISPLSVPTSILSFAPGGLFEMVITATEVGGDPAVVSALQLMRILIIVLFVPPILGWYFRRRVRKDTL